MGTDSKHLEELPFYLAFGVAVAGMVSIAASHILLGIAVAALLVRNRGFLRLPRMWLLVALFLAGTVLALVVSDEPRAGLPQLKKFYVWLALLTVYSGLRSVRQAAITLLGMAAAACASGGWGLVQFVMKYRRASSAGQPFYQAYVADRITGANSHWQTFSAQLMIGLLILLALLLFLRGHRWSRWALMGTGLLSLALLLAFTRSVWGGAAAGIVFLLCLWRPVALLALPALGVAVMAVAPEPVRQRIESTWRPDSKLDSNEHRSVLRQTGYRMIAANPWFGVGPEQVGRRVTDFAPPDVPRPLPREWYVGHLHNVYLQYAAERGIPVLLIGLAILLIPLRDFLRQRKAAEAERRFVLMAASAGIVAIMVSGWWEYNLGDSEVLGCFLSLVACGYAAAPEDSAATTPRR